MRDGARHCDREGIVSELVTHEAVAHLVASLSDQAIADFLVDFMDEAPADPRLALIELLVSGAQDPTSGCPQTMAGIRQLLAEVSS